MALRAVSPIDGRYSGKIKELEEIFSEYALIKKRLEVEALYLLFLSRKKIIRRISAKEKKFLNELLKRFNEREAREVKRIEKKTNHDVKAVEYYLRKKTKKSTLKNLSEFIHFGLTSEDVSNLAYALMLQEGLREFNKSTQAVLKKIVQFTKKHKKTAMLSHTHGQPSSPTTLGKELMVFALRLNGQLKELNARVLPGKLNSAVGNFNAQKIAFPKIKWGVLAKEFTESLSLKYQPVTTQIISHEEISQVLRNIVSVNNVLVDLNRDLWHYTSMDYLKQKVVKGEVGSSIMPQKVNPIMFENSEGNLLLANAVLSFLADELQTSRLQRDLTDSTIKRNYGVGFAYSIIGLKSCLAGLERIEANKERMLKGLRETPEVLAEAVQTVMRKNMVPEAYEKLKGLSRGKKLSLEEIRQFISKQKIGEDDRKRLMKLEPKDYIGEAQHLVEAGLKELKK